MEPWRRRGGGGGQIDSRDSWGRSQLWQSHQEGLFVWAMYSICSVQGIHTTMHCLVLCTASGLRERTQEGLTARGESATAKEGRICYVDDDHWNFADVTRVLFRIICFSICLIWKVGLGDVRKTQLRQLASSCVQSMNLQQYEWSLKGYLWTPCPKGALRFSASLRASGLGKLISPEVGLKWFSAPV